MHHLADVSRSLSTLRDPGPLVRSAFDPNMSARLRQAMPLPLVKQPSHVEAWAEMQHILEDMALLDTLADTPQPVIWQVRRL